MKHPLTKKVLKNIRIIASKLPVETDGESTNWVSGAEILRGNPDAKTAKGEPIESKKWYSVKTGIPTENHNKRMCAAYQSKGEQGVQDYINAIVEREKNKQESKKQAA